MRPKTLGGLDAVVANVSAMADAVGAAEENWSASFNVDLMHSVRLVEVATPYLEQSDAASITLISSVSGRDIDFTAALGVMKGALIHYGHSLAYNLAPKGIRANVVSPGNTYFEGGFWAYAEQNMPDFFQTQMGLNPTGRFDPGRGGRRCRVPGQSAGQPHHRNQPACRRCPGQRRAVLARFPGARDRT